jgi:tRNA (guanine6-N2)-methyltransferase
LSILTHHTHYELEVAPGIETIVQEELLSLLGTRMQILSVQKGGIQFTTDVDSNRLKTLKTVNTVYRLLTFLVPRPKALLGHQYLKQIIAEIQVQQKLETFQTLSISAAGQESAIMTRLRDEICQATHLKPADEIGDMRLRIRPSVTQKNAWEVLVRLTPRPLATRVWRTENMQGALNAPVAHAMLRLLHLQPSDVLLNIGCGSGTFLAEATAFRPKLCVGCDISSENLDLTHTNLKTFNTHSLSLLQADVERLPFDDNTVSAICSDLPFGQLVATPQAIQTLYPIWLRESARVLKQHQPCVLITHAIRLIENTIQQQSHLWIMEEVYPITLNGLHPRIYLLRRK